MKDDSKLENNLGPLSLLLHRLQREKRMEIDEANNGYLGRPRYEATILGAFGQQSPQSNLSDPAAAGGMQSVAIVRTEVCESFLPAHTDDGLTERQRNFSLGCHPVLNQDMPISSNIGAKCFITPQGESGSPETTGEIRQCRITGFSAMDIASMQAQGGMGGCEGAECAADAFAAGGFQPVTEINNTIQGKEFVVSGVKYLSMPASDAAANAKGLYDNAVAAGMPAEKKRGNSWETTAGGRAWIQQNIYLPMIKKRPTKFPDPEASAKSFADKLGTGSESYWSSWFFRNAYINHWHAKDSGKWEEVALGLHSGHVYDYTSSEGLDARQQIEANPDAFKDKEAFLLFQTKEAPLFPGDAVFNIREGAKSFSSVTPTGKQLPAHMRVLISNTVAVGGNEGQQIGYNPIKLDANNVLDDPKDYYQAIYKRVKVIGKA